MVGQKRIGVFSSPFELSDSILKHALLSCDEIGMANLNNYLERQLENIEPEVAASYDFLRGKSLIREALISEQAYNQVINPSPRPPRPFTGKEAVEYFGSWADWRKGCLAAALINHQLLGECITVPFFRSFNSLSLVSHIKDHGTECLSIILKQIPVPEDDVSIQDVLDFSTAEQAVRHRSALNDWLNGKVREGATASELADELAYLINEYTEFMKISKMRFRTTVSEAIIKMPFEISGGLATLRLTKVVEALFSFRRIYLDLREAELKAPGREVAYIVDAQDRFLSQNK